MTNKELINHILTYCSKKNYPDIHINTGKKIKIRNDSGFITDLEKIDIDSKQLIIPEITLETIKSIISILAWKIWYEKFEREMELDISYLIDSWDRFRVNCYMDSDGYSIALRIIPNKIPDLDELWLWEQVKKMCNSGKWLILVTWPTGSWKSTNLAAMIDYINKNTNRHIITIEDPIEFSFVWKKSLINQREVWSHTKSFSSAIRASLREDPDVIMIWEMRDPETIKAAITLAETWHLVLSTLHTNDSVQTVDRIVDVFPDSSQKQIRMQLAMSLSWIVSQRLVPRSDKSWRIAAREILIANDATRNLIISWKTHQLYSVLEVGQTEWMILMDKYLIALFKKEVINKETLISYARDKEGIEMMFNNEK
jgi:twitching motility protein PilT